MRLIGTAWVLAAVALAFSIYWAAAHAPPQSASGVVPVMVAFVGAVAITAATNYAVARRRGRTSLAPLVLAAVVSVAISEEGGLLLGGLWQLTVPVTLFLCARSVDRLSALRQPAPAAMRTGSS